MLGILDDIKSMFFPGARITALRELAQRKNWRFKARSKFISDPIALFPFDLFQGKKDKRLLGVMIPPVTKGAGSFRIYDYTFYGSFGRRETTVFEYQVATENSLLEFPIFSIQPKGPYKSIRKIFFKKIEPIIPTTPEFRENYTIATNDTMEFRQSLHESFLDEVGELPGWTYEGRENIMISYQLGNQLSVSEIETHTEYFQNLCRLLERP